MYPPHLPPPSCDIKNHYRWINVKIILASSFLGFIAGLAGASSAIGWLWPGFGGGDTLIVARNMTSNINLDEIVRKESNERIFSIYKEYNKNNDLIYLPSTEKIGEAVMISSDGWLAMYAKENNFTSLNKMRALSFGGVIYEIKQYIFDVRTNIVYFKIASLPNLSADTNNQFKIASFEEVDLTHLEVFIKTESDWQLAQVGYKKYISPATKQLDSVINYHYLLEGNFSVGQIVINDRGRVLGFVTENNTILPVVALTRIMPEILSNNKIKYPSLGVYGWFTTAQPTLNSKGENLEGFVVSEVWHKNSVLKKGDVITEINGQVAKSENLWYNNNNKPIVLAVIRDNKIIELTTELFFTF